MVTIATQTGRNTDCHAIEGKGLSDRDRSQGAIAVAITVRQPSDTRDIPA